MCWFSFWWKVPKEYMTLEQFFVSARTIKRHHHHQGLSIWGHPDIVQASMTDTAGEPRAGIGNASPL
jgi:hypothetical protein